MKKVVILGTIVLLMSTTYAGLYRWVDESGEVHYSDKMPASASKKAHAKIDKNGMITKKIDPQAAVEAANKDKLVLSQLEMERVRLEKIEQERHRETEKKRKRDEYLLSTYDSKDELIRYFENKIKLVQGNSRNLEAQSNNLKKKLAKLEVRKKTVKHKPTLNAIIKKIQRINVSLGQFKKAMEDNKEALSRLNSNYLRDKQRYAELTEKH